MLAAVTAGTIDTVAAIGWEPEIRGALTVVLSVAILCGSVYLILATNTGARLGFLLAFTGLMGWMLLMGILWTIYGIGLIGDAPTWVVSEVVIGDISQAETEEARSLDDWSELPPGDGDRGDAQAAADDFIANNGQDVFGPEVPSLITVAAYDRGGKDELEANPPCSPHRPSTYDGCWDRIVHKLETTFVQPLHPTHYAVIQVQPASVEQGAPSATEADPSSPEVSLIMVRDLGDRRLPPILVTVFSGIMFALGAWQLHRRDRQAMAARAAIGA